MVIMLLSEFSNGMRVLWCLSGEEYLKCINAEDREYVGDDKLWERFCTNPHRTFVELPDQDQERLFSIIAHRNYKAGLSVCPNHMHYLCADYTKPPSKCLAQSGQCPRSP